MCSDTLALKCHRCDTALQRMGQIINPDLGPCKSKSHAAAITGKDRAREMKQVRSEAKRLGFKKERGSSQAGMKCCDKAPYPHSLECGYEPPSAALWGWRWMPACSSHLERTGASPPHFHSQQKHSHFLKGGLQANTWERKQFITV